MGVRRGLGCTWSAGGVEIGREGVSVDAPIPPNGAPANQKKGATEFEGTIDPEIAERWWEKVEDVLNLVDCTLENRLKYVAFLFVGNALIWWRPKMYRDKKRMEFLNLVQGDDQTVAEYELRFAALAKYALEVVVTQEDHCCHFEQGLRPEIKKSEVVSRGLVDQWALTKVRLRAVPLLRLLLDQVEELDRVTARSELSLLVVLLVGGDIWDNIGDQMLYRGSISGPGAEKGRGRGRGRGTGNRDGDHSIGTILLFDIEAYVLMDPGSTRSYISSELASKIPGENSPSGCKLMVYLSMGGGVVVNSVRKGSLVRIGDVNLPVDLVMMDLKEFDVILGMDWLAQHRAVVDCYKKEVIASSSKTKVVFVGERQVVPDCVISAIEARRLLLEGCEAYLAHVIDAEKVNPTLEEIPVVRDFPEVFPDDLPVCHHIEKWTLR
ncbi:UNVERIFIED_CONTAM: hypothetical protein Slati_0807700 [Sesamum latifolium]|uniref:Retrotransposon gag domain-containing protein n=1 Tax=Sesamum latifolium TaxID=2727402 RepID=A0AAW2XLT9_9LAMI